MHRHIQQLAAIAQQPSRRIIGLMSGTSLDGLDVALCNIQGHGTTSRVQIERFTIVEYDDDYRSRVKTIFSRRNVDLQTVCLMNEWIAIQHANMVLSCLSNWQLKSADIDLIASHGQTIYHCPRLLHGDADLPNATLQIGDGDHIARITGITTISDFRQKHLAAGGEGAPLAMYGDFFLFSDPQQTRVLLNLGGIANLTWLPQNLNPADVLSTDVGPGNTLMDALVQRHESTERFDQDAALARRGTINTSLLAALLDDPFFDSPLPKTIGPELFNLDYLDRALAQSSATTLAIEDQLATLNRFSAEAIANAIHKVQGTQSQYAIFVSGGGLHNTLLMDNIHSLLPGITLQSTQTLGIDPDAKEAVLFALLANETIAGTSLAFGDLAATTMGKVSFPD